MLEIEFETKPPKLNDCNIGIEIASENAGRTTRNIVVRNHLIYNNAIGGIFIGGSDADRGGAEDCWAHLQVVAISVKLPD